MKKITQMNESLLQHYNENVKQKKHPQLTMHHKQKGKEAFSCQYAGGTISLEAETALSAAFGIHQIIAGVGSGHYLEFLGEWQSRFALRPLWLGCDCEVTLIPAKTKNGVGINLPAFLWDEKSSLDSFCERVIQLGYNSVLLGSRKGMFGAILGDEENFNLEQVCSAFHEYGLKVILKPNIMPINKAIGRSPIDHLYVSAIQHSLREFIQKVPSLDFLFWEGDFLHPECRQHPSVYNLTLAEIVTAEVHMLEEALEGKIPLIYYVPSVDLVMSKQQSVWMPALCDEINISTTLAFSAVAGAPFADHLSPHPFWEKLRKCSDPSAIKLMPIVNLGGVQQGEGFWPALTLDLVDKFIGRCRGHHFGGAITLANHLPALGTLQDCCLWVASQYMWKERPTSLLAETWFLTYRKDLDYGCFVEPLKNVREIVIELSRLRSLNNEKQREGMTSEECRLLAESLLIRLKYLQMQFAKEEKKRVKRAERPSYFEYFTYFARDARRIIANAAQCFNETLPRSMTNEDPQDGFWTKGDSGFRPGKAVFLDQPQQGTPRSRMEMIYRENYLF